MRFFSLAMATLIVSLAQPVSAKTTVCRELNALVRALNGDITKLKGSVDNPKLVGELEQGPLGKDANEYFSQYVAKISPFGLRYCTLHYRPVRPGYQRSSALTQLYCKPEREYVAPRECEADWYHAHDEKVLELAPMAIKNGVEQAKAACEARVAAASERERSNPWDTPEYPECAAKKERRKEFDSWFSTSRDDPKIKSLYDERLAHMLKCVRQSSAAEKLADTAKMRFEGATELAADIASCGITSVAKITKIGCDEPKKGIDVDCYSGDETTIRLELDPSSRPSVDEIVDDKRFIDLYVQREKMGGVKLFKLKYIDSFTAKSY